MNKSKILKNLFCFILPLLFMWPANWVSGSIQSHFWSGLSDVKWGDDLLDRSFSIQFILESLIHIVFLVIFVIIGTFIAIKLYNNWNKGFDWN